MPSWGRPQGARGSRRRRRWEHEQALWEEGARVEELDSDDDTDTQGVGLNFQEKRFASDPLQFTGIDLTSGPRSRRRYTYDDETESSDETSEESDEEDDAMQIAMRDKEEALVQSALARIRRAQEKGKREVKLNQDELDALERRRKRMQSAATAKTSRKDSGSGSGNEKRRSNRQSVSLPGLLSGEPISRKGKAKRIENVPAGPAAPGMVVSGPDGPTHYPLGYYPPQANGSRGSPSRPRSSTNRELPPPQYRHFSDNTRPTSSSSNGSRRPMPDDDDWVPSNSRRTSVSSHASYSDPFQYQTSSGHPPPIPEQYMQSSGRRNVSGPAEVSYSSVRRSLPTGAYPTSSRATASDPSLTRGRDGEMPDSQSSSEGDQSDDLGNGVQVFVEEKAPEKERAVVPSRKPVGTNKKRGKGR